MNILLCVREDYIRNYGGDSCQVLKTAKFLEKFGVKIHINSGNITDYSKYDIIHLFNITNVWDTYNYYKIANKYKKKIVVSPAYYNLTKYFKFKNNEEGLKLWEKSNVYRKEILKGSHAVVVNSKLESENIKSDFSINNKCQVIYSGVEVEDESIPLYNIRERYKLNSYILCVASIHPKNNQLLLAKICNELGIELLLIGKIKNEDYYKECIKYEKVLYLGFMDSYNIYNAYRFARLHVLPSYFENLDISSMEAAACGCNIVSTVEGSSREYFNDMALYCNPYDEKSIYNAVKKGLMMPKSQKLKNYVKSNYTWGKYINCLYKCYNNLIG